MFLCTPPTPGGWKSYKFRSTEFFVWLGITMSHQLQGTYHRPLTALVLINRKLVITQCLINISNNSCYAQVHINRPPHIENTNLKIWQIVKDLKKKVALRWRPASLSMSNTFCTNLQYSSVNIARTADNVQHLREHKKRMLLLSFGLSPNDSPKN